MRDSLSREPTDEIPLRLPGPLMDWLGWSALTPTEQMTGISGGMIGGGAVLSYYALLWIPRKRAQAKKRRKKGKAKARRRR